AAAVERPLLLRPHAEQPAAGGGQGRPARRRSIDLARAHRRGGDAHPTLWPDLGCRIMSVLNSALLGAVSMADFVAMLFFLGFWRQTRESLFLFFAVAFGIDAAMRLLLALTPLSEETEPLVYLARLVTFALIIIAIVRKNRPRRPG